MARIQNVEYLYGWYTKDGHLKNNEGRIVIYDGAIMIAYSPSMDHNYLLRAMASRYKINKDKVINKAIRLYYAHEGNRIVISPVRKIDDDMMNENLKYYAQFIKENLK